MKRISLLICAILIGVAAFATTPVGIGEDSTEWKAKWICKEHTPFRSNTWFAFRKTAQLGVIPSSVKAKIAADSKYWLWINGSMVVYDGGLKRGPAPGDGYYDTVEIAPYLKEGENVISVLVWFLGQGGFSHISSGLAALLFQAEGEGVEILSDESWECNQAYSYQTSHSDAPNYRLCEENIRYDAEAYPEDWFLGQNPKKLGSSMELPCTPGEAPLGRLVCRPIPLWKVSGLKDYSSVSRNGDTLVCTLPCNLHAHPWIRLNAEKGKILRFHTDHRKVTGNMCQEGEYVTRDGIQEYESLPWMNGEKVYYHIPEGVEVLEVKYRESSYNTSISGSFHCDNDVLNTYWTKAARTLMVCMRDTWYDCPDRERAQWWGDEVNELGEAFYALSPSSALLAAKGIRELAAWHKGDGSMFAPCPASNWSRELPMQILASVGWYGWYTYGFYSGDFSFVEDVYEPLHRYLHETWKVDENGLPIYRKGGWDWPDAGDNNDRWAILPPWYYLALKAEREFALMLGKEEDAKKDKAMMQKLAENYNRQFWNGYEYRSANYEGPTDDRANALAVVSGIAGEEKYPAIIKTLSEQAHASSYMFKYILEALHLMGRDDMMLERMERFYPSLMKDECSTLYEAWNHQGTSNHAWSGSGIIIMGGTMAGIKPLESGFRRFEVNPNMGSLKEIDCSLETVYGKISVSLRSKGSNGIKATICVPEGTECRVVLRNNTEALLGPGEHKVVIKKS